MQAFLVIIGSYLLGSIPFSHIFPKLKGEDVSQKGTKNIGATNALVVAGPIIGALALIGDLAKGYLAVSIAKYYFVNPWIVVLAGLAAIIGHDFSIFLKFKGGKGIATTGGCLLAIAPVFALIVILLWGALILITRYFIPSTLLILGTLPITTWAVGKRLEYIVFAVGVFLLALFTHRNDVKRLLAGQELRTGDAVKHYMGK